MPNAGLPELTADGAQLPADAGGAGRRARHVRPRVRPRPRRRLLRHDAGAPPPGRRARARPRGRRPREPAGPGRRPRSTSTCRSGRTRRTCRSASGPTPTAARRSARRCSPSDWDDCVEIAREPDPRRRAPARPLRRLRRPRRRRRHARRPRPGSPPRRRCRSMLDSTEPPVIEAGLEMLGGRCVVNSVNYEDGDGPGVALRPDHADRQGARRRGRRADHRRGGPGAHGRVEGRASPRG